MDTGTPERLPISPCRIKTRGKATHFRRVCASGRSFHVDVRVTRQMCAPLWGRHCAHTSLARIRKNDGYGHEPGQATGWLPRDWADAVLVVFSLRTAPDGSWGQRLPAHCWWSPANRPGPMAKLPFIEHGLRVEIRVSSLCQQQTSDGCVAGGNETALAGCDGAGGGGGFGRPTHHIFQEDPGTQKMSHPHGGGIVGQPATHPLTQKQQGGTRGGGGATTTGLDATHPHYLSKLGGGGGAVGGGVWHVAFGGGVWREGGGDWRYGGGAGGGGLLERHAIPSLQQSLKVKRCHGVSLGCTKAAEQGPNT